MINEEEERMPWFECSSELKLITYYFWICQGSYY